MKKLSLILNVVLLLAVAFLYYAKFSDSTDSDNTIAGENNSGTKNLTIAYINSDTLFARYKYYEEVGKVLDEKRLKLQQEYTRRAEGLQRQIDDYQRTVTNLTIAQARAVEEDLGSKTQNLRQYQEAITQELLKKEAEITQELYNKIATYLKTYGDSNNLQIVLTYSQGSNVLYANESLDITQQVIEGLNLQYDVDSGILLSDSTAIK